jgi:SAM-dependent methyltransferase
VQPEEYLRMAAVEDDMWFYRALHSHLERELIFVTKDQVVSDLLDAGCGTGGLIRRLEQRHTQWKWTGVELEPLACELARTRCAARILQGSVLALPFAENNFDAVVCSDVLYHVDDDVAALREIFRVLRPGGAVVINVPAHRWLWSYHDVATHARRRYVCKEVVEKLCASGFCDARATHWNTLPLPLVLIKRKLLPAPRDGSDVRLYGALAERLLSMAMGVERAWLRRRHRLPFGSSILAVGSKPFGYRR